MDEIRELQNELTSANVSGRFNFILSKTNYLENLLLPDSPNPRNLQKNFL